MKRATYWCGIAAAALWAGMAWGATWTDGSGVTWTYDAEAGSVLGASPATGALTVPEWIGDCMISDIADEAFKGCTGLTSLTLPNSLEGIGPDAFLGSGLTVLRVPEDWDSGMLMGKGVPAGCTVWYGSRSEVWADEGDGEGGGGGEGEEEGEEEGGEEEGDGTWTDGNGVTWTYDAGTGTLLGASPATGTLTIPGTIQGCTITAIGAEAFKNCAGLTSVTIPGSVTNIGNRAFYYCTGLTSVTIPGSVTGIGDSAFCRCESLASATISASVESIGSGAFEHCNSLASVTFEAGLKGIGKDMFCMCTNLASVTVPASVESVGDGAFQSCANLSSVTIEAGVEAIGESVFFKCAQLTELTIPGSVTSIGNGTFGSTGLETLYVAAKYEGTGYLDDTALPAGCTVVYGDPPVVVEGIGLVKNEGRVTWTITFPGQEDVRYHVEWSRDLTQTNGWRDLGTMFVQQTYTNGMVILQGVETKKGAFFYRVMVPGED